MNEVLIPVPYYHICSARHAGVDGVLAEPKEKYALLKTYIINSIY
jgi:hypothetical protein